MNTRNTGIRSWAEANAFLGGRKQKNLPGRDSVLARVGDDIAVKYHWTDVVTYHPDGTATLNSNGWMSLTTKQRFNAYTHASVYQKNHKWYVGNNVPYRDGMLIDASGNPIGGGGAVEGSIEALASEVKALLRR
jgi:hypothetical protein